MLIVWFGLFFLLAESYYAIFSWFFISFLMILVGVSFPSGLAPFWSLPFIRGQLYLRRSDALFYFILVSHVL